jgi:plastocyanin
MPKSWRFLPLLWLSLSLPPSVASAANYLVGIGDDCLAGGVCFSPSPLAIRVGDTVRFFVYYSNDFHGDHNVVADDGSFRCARGCDGEGGNGSPNSSSWSFSRTFDTPGIVAYHDETSNLKGLLVVQEAGTPDELQTAYEFIYGFSQERLPVNSFFVTADADEASNISGGRWHYTLETFLAWKGPAGGALPTCRFLDTQYGSHFFSPYAGECSALQQQPRWLYEGIAFYLKLPDAGGNCPLGTNALYRLYNQSAHTPPHFPNGRADVPLHRYTTSVATVARMRAAGWITEGDERTSTFACVLF